MPGESPLSQELQRLLEKRTSSDRRKKSADAHFGSDKRRTQRRKSGSKKK